MLGDLPALGPLPPSVRNAATGYVRLRAAGLSAAAGLASWLEYTLPRRRVIRKVSDVTLAGGKLLPLLLALIPTGIAAVAIRILVMDMYPLVGGIAAVTVAATVYLAFAILLGVSELREILASRLDRYPG